MNLQDLREIELKAQEALAVNGSVVLDPEILLGLIGSLRAVDRSKNPDPRFDDTTYLVEATSFELHHLWKNRGEDEWVQDLRGFFVTIGHVDGRPNSISYQWYHINGKRIGFYELCSQLADHKMADDYHRSLNNGRGIPTVSASNFDKCLQKVRVR